MDRCVGVRIGNKGASTSCEQRLDVDVPDPAASARLVFRTEPLYGDWTVLCVRSSRICVRSLYDQWSVRYGSTVYVIPKY